MNLLFWNLNRNSNIENYVANIITEQSIDIAVFCEYNNVDFDKVCLLLDSHYSHHDGMGGCNKVTLLAQNDISVNVSREHSRYTIYTCIVNTTPYILTGAHLPDNSHSCAEDRKNVIRELIKDLTEQERKDHISNTIIVGDFNCNPFDEELIQKDCFNAVLFKELIKSQETVTYSRKKYKRFYNPMIHYISENTMNYGSYYYGSGINALYWNCFDQVIVRKSLVDAIQSIKFCKSIKNLSLMNRLTPNDNISDHLPLLINFERIK